jgi:hypothetical protein
LLGDFQHDLAWYNEDRELATTGVEFDQALIRGMRGAATSIPENACVYSIKPSILGFYGRRIGMVPPKPRLNDGEFAAALAADGCKYFFLIGSVSPSYQVPYYPIERIGAFRVLDKTTAPGWSGPVSILVERIE